MKPGPERKEALKKAGQLQSAADMMGYLNSKELQPRSEEARAVRYGKRDDDDD